MDSYVILHGLFTGLIVIVLAGCVINFCKERKD